MVKGNLAKDPGRRLSISSVFRHRREILSSSVFITGTAALPHCVILGRIKMFRWDKALFTAPVLSYCHCLNCFGRVVIIAAPPVRRSGCAVFPVWQRYIFVRMKMFCDCAACQRLSYGKLLLIHPFIYLFFSVPSL